MNFRILLILFFLIFSSCSDFDKAEYISKDRRERGKLINALFSDRDDDYFSMDCIREKDHHLQSLLDDEENIDFKQFFKYYKVINAKFLVEKIGMNPTLLSQYVQGHKKPSTKQTEKILNGINQIGQELSGINLLRTA